jgi:hypothetical protein
MAVRARDKTRRELVFMVINVHGFDEVELAVIASSVLETMS